MVQVPPTTRKYHGRLFCSTRSRSLACCHQLHCSIVGIAAFVIIHLLKWGHSWSRVSTLVPQPNSKKKACCLLLVLGKFWSDIIISFIPGFKYRITSIDWSRRARKKNWIISDEILVGEMRASYNSLSQALVVESNLSSPSFFNFHVFNLGRFFSWITQAWISLRMLKPIPETVAFFGVSPERPQRVTYAYVYHNTVASEGYIIYSWEF